MKKAISIILVLGAIIGIVALKKQQPNSIEALPTHTSGIPRLLDLGSKDCAACKMLEPVLDELRGKHPDQLQVDFIDVWKHEKVSAQYGVEIIPVQIFFGANGREIYRHQGFISTEEVENKFRELGVVLDAE